MQLQHGQVDVVQQLAEEADSTTGVEEDDDLRIDPSDDIVGWLVGGRAIYWTFLSRFFFRNVNNNRKRFSALTTT